MKHVKAILQGFISLIVLAAIATFSLIFIVFLVTSALNMSFWIFLTLIVIVASYIIGVSI